MSEENDYKKAIGLLMAGQRKEASVALLNLYQRTTKSVFRIKLIDALLSALDPVRENQKLIDMSSEGIKLASELQAPNLQAHFMGRKADFLMNKLSFCRYQASNLKLAPGWLGFSTEADKNNYEALIVKIEKIEKEISQLLTEALNIAEKANSKKTLAFVLMSRASIESSRYLRYKTECLLGTRKVKVWLLLHKWGFEVPILFGFKHYKALKIYIDSFTADYLKAAKLLEEIGSEEASFAYYDLAVRLETAYRFRQAKNYLRKAKIIAGKHCSVLLNSRIKLLEKSIGMRNRDVPNYLD